MKAALLFDEKPAPAETDRPDDTFEEYDDPPTVFRIAATLRRLGATVEPAPADRRLPSRLEAGCFNFACHIAEGLITLVDRARCRRQAVPAAFCELRKVPFTGSHALLPSFTLDKDLAHRVVSPEVLVAPGMRLEDEPWHDLFSGLRFPVMVKPNEGGRGAIPVPHDQQVLGNLLDAVHRAGVNVS
jgi:hypothetical protein